MRNLASLLLTLFISACAVEGSHATAAQPASPTQASAGDESSLPDCDSLPSHVEHGSGSIGPGQTTEPGKVYGSPPTQAELDQREKELANTHLPAGPRCRSKPVEGPPSPVPPTSPTPARRAQ
jgi:hypothetical protein